MPTPNRTLFDLISELEDGMFEDAVTHRHGRDRHCQFCGGIVPGELCEDHAASARYAEILDELRGYAGTGLEDHIALDLIAETLDEQLASVSISPVAMVNATIAILADADRLVGRG